MLSCGQCNRPKGNCFDISKKSKRAEYKGETLKELQYKTYPEELPMLINPEQISEDEFKKQFTFEVNEKNIGKIIAKTDEMQYTIDICDLNRVDLIALRSNIINDLNNKIKYINTNYWYNLKIIEKEKAMEIYVRDIAKSCR